jgi:hypothetical protein
LGSQEKSNHKDFYAYKIKNLSVNNIFRMLTAYIQGKLLFLRIDSKSSCARRMTAGSIDDFPLWAFIISDLLYVFGISSAVEIEPEKRTVAFTLILFGVEQSAGPFDTALCAPVTGARTVRPCGSNPNPRPIRARHGWCCEWNGKHPSVIRVSDPFDDELQVGDGERQKMPVVL